MMMKQLTVVGAALALAACALGKQDAPSPTGPSGYGLSLDATASPDHLTQNGSSQAVITVLARDASNQPIRGLAIQADLFVDGLHADFGTLSSRTVSTASDGRATFAYLSPPPDPPSVESDHVVTVMFTPVGTDFANATPRVVSLVLMRPGVILPPNGTPTPAFFFSPSSPHENETTLFDGSASTDDGTIVSYAWSFGDGTGGSGMRANHSYAVAGTYNVILTVKDDRGLSASTSPKPVTVLAAANPVASFTISPSNPNVGASVFFNAAGSSVPPGRTIVSYEWDFGDGSTGTGLTTSHVYGQAKSFTIVLTVTDSTGLKTSTSRSLQITP
jgi:chitodextrinase